MKMVVPGSAPIIQPDHSLGTELGRGSTESSVMGADAEPRANRVGSELEEVRKLQELVRRLELQNQQLRTRSLRSVPEAKMLSQADAGVDNCNSRLNNGMEMNTSISALMDKQELQIVADLHCALSKMRSEVEESDEFLKKDVEATVQPNSASASREESSNIHFASNVDMRGSGDNISSFSNWGCGNATLVEDFMTTGDEPALRMSEGSTDLEDFLNETALDEVELLELENSSDAEDSW